MYKSLLVHVDGSSQSAVRVAVAADLATVYEAHLVGTALTGLSPYMLPASTLEPGAPPLLFPLEGLHAEADRALDAFDEQVRRTGLTSFERRRVDDEAGVGVSVQGRYCDLIIVGQQCTDAFNPPVRADFPEYVLFNSGRPVLIVPATGVQAQIGKRVMVAWDGSAHALRAITSAIALLQRATAVKLVVINPQQGGDLHGQEPGADMALYLSRHGIAVELNVVQTVSDVGDTLISTAVEHGSDLLVMGAYGHSRLREFFLGGCTRTALRSSPIALWMAH